MKNNLRLAVDTLRRNYRFTHYPVTALDPFEEPVKILDAFHKAKAAIDVDRKLTPEGKDAARLKLGKDTLEAIAKWHAPRLSGLDADLDAQRTALLPQPSKPPDGRKLDFLLSRLRDRTPEDVAVLYNSATDAERVDLETLSASVGRIPIKSANGLEWKPLLDPEAVNRSVMGRAVAKNPEGVKRFEELTEIRAAHVGVAGVAAAEVREALDGYKLEG